MSPVITASSLFWLTAGLLLGVAISLSFGHWWRAGVAANNRRVFALSLAGGGAFALTAILLYAFLGRPDVVTGERTHLNAEAGAAAQANSIEEATKQLAARLAKDGGSDGDWELLAQSYDFMGRTAEAEQARSRRVASTKDDPAGGEDFIQIAKNERQQHNYAAARAAFERAIQLNAMTADSWADYADTLASLQTGPNKFAGAAEAIDHALKLNPNHAKALWLKASIAHDERRYADSLALWKRLRNVVGASETDARIIDANIAEAEELLGQSKDMSDTRASPAAQVVIVGTVDLDPSLAKRVSPGSTLFIYAKAIDSPGPPLAVMRTAVDKWPFRFRLDDSMAMMPNRNLSSVGEVLVEARVSKSGVANAAAGDLQATAARVNARSGKPVKLRIDKVVS